MIGANLSFFYRQMTGMPPKLSEMTKMPQKHILMTKMPQTSKYYTNDGNATLFLHRLFRRL
jgi:hypothetical protein